MSGGVIIAQKVAGDVYFLSEAGKELLPPALEVEARLGQEFGGLTLDDAVGEAKKFGISALQQKMVHKTRYQNCRLVVKNLKLDYKVKYGFTGEEPQRPQRPPQPEEEGPQP